MSAVYHASSQKNLKSIKPQRTLSQDVYIGDFVFATKDERLAAMYLATKGTPVLMQTDDAKPYIVICAEKNAYLASDSGGAIYTLPANSFEATPQAGLENYELVSRQEVKPISSVAYDRSIDAMLGKGVAVYFADEETFSKFMKSKNKEALKHTLVAL